MKEYFVSAMVPINMIVEAENFEKAVDEYMDHFDFDDMRIGDDDMRIGDVDSSCGIAVTNQETGEQRIL